MAIPFWWERVMTLKIDIEDWKKKLGIYLYFCTDGIVRKWDNILKKWKPATKEELTKGESDEKKEI